MRLGRLAFLGPAFVAAIAYVDPGNVAANLTAGAKYGYLLVWVLVLANAIAVFVQYQSAKLGLVTGRSLPELLGERLANKPRKLFWVQAELVAAATDIAEIIGGAIALYLLWGVPLPLGGLIVGVVSTVILGVQNRSGQRAFELVIISFLGIIVIGFLAGLFVKSPDWGQVIAGLQPKFDGAETVLLAASIMGATVMPHVIYAHSALVRDRHGKNLSLARIKTLLVTSKVDVTSALIIAGTVNLAMLLLAAVALSDAADTSTIEGAHVAIDKALGSAVSTFFAIALLASSLASTAVGGYAGADIMAGLLKIKFSLVWRRIIVMLPAIAVLFSGLDSTGALILSQVILSLGIPFAIIPLIRLNSSSSLMGQFRSRMLTKITGYVLTFIVIALNVALLILAVFE